MRVFIRGEGSIEQADDTHMRADTAAVASGCAVCCVLCAVCCTRHECCSRQDVAEKGGMSNVLSHLHHRRQAGRHKAQVLATDQHVSGSHQRR
jgi:hypothetical protein